MAISPEGKIKELEAKLNLLEQQNTHLKTQLERSEQKSIIFDLMVDLAEKEYNDKIKQPT